MRWLSSELMHSMPHVIFLPEITSHQEIRQML